MSEQGDCAAAAVESSQEGKTARDGLECRIQIPRKLLPYLMMEGIVPTMIKDRRRSQRYYYHVQAVLHYRQTRLDVPRSEGRCYLVLTKDISRKGVCFFHEEQLFPQERMMLDLPSGKCIEVEVNRCVKHNEQCFEIGATLIGPAS